MTKKLVPVMLIIAGLCFLGALTSIIVSPATNWPSTLGLTFGSVAIALALVVMVRRQTRAQAKTQSMSRQTLLRIGNSAEILAGIGAQNQSLAAASARLVDLVDELSGSVDGTLAAIGEMNVELAAIRKRFDSIHSGPDWTAAKWEKLGRRLAGGKFGVEEVTRRLVSRDVSALLSMHELVKVKGEPLHNSSYVATPETLLALVSLVPGLPDGAVLVEAGSGLSTVWLALAIEQSGRSVSIISLEHEPKYASVTRAALARQGIANNVSVEVRDAPLVVNTIDGRDYSWYSPEGFRDLTRIDVLFVDGPPASTGPDARYPAMPLLAHALVDGAIVILDDIDREDEKQSLERWLARSADRGTLAIERQLDRAVLLRYRCAQT